MRRSSRLLVALVCALLVLAACGLPRERGDAPPSTVPVDAGEVDAVLARYEKVRDTAAELLDPKPLSTVESGAVLAIDTGSFEVAQRLARAVGGDSASNDVVRLATPRFTAYPLWFMVEVQDRAAEVNRVQIFERASAVDPWFLVASPETLLTTQLPDLRERDGVQLVVPPDSATGMSMSPQEAADRYAAVLADPASPAASSLEQDDFIEQMRAAAERNASLEDVSFTQTWSAQEVRHVLRTADGGALVFATLERVDSYEVGEGVRVTWPDDSPQKALLESGLSSSGSLRYLHQVLVSIPGGSGKPRVIGQYGGVVEAQGP
ncbi:MULTISPECIES: hypothetical protein [unclassified Aeromicrobium]|uniref:hypothetical protein n=1 Tax=unclassified Aeromicrobium TaxID=2633570 RepID=UPI000700CF06|nr:MULTISPECIES: hypothetical protein [unclassified Aeromicrobium]KQO38711.1 hypothetical protein ASF05_02120 [Aeromicrobium sp. Leaf245]KQP79954.1 hypothetical protein ASF37_02840 [Aeromicrobium sp. Leaf289]KQP81960.1 hypothetical protein ASF35_10870 [Aeromicrobium sp. Leaf291]